MKSKTNRAKKLSLGKTTIQNINKLDLKVVRGGESVKVGYPCVWDPDAGMYISAPGYGSTCPPKIEQPVNDNLCIQTCHCLYY